MITKLSYSAAAKSTRCTCNMLRMICRALCYMSDLAMNPFKAHFYLAVAAVHQPRSVILHQKCTITTDIDRYVNKHSYGCTFDKGNWEYQVRCSAWWLRILQISKLPWLSGAATLLSECPTSLVQSCNIPHLCTNSVWAY